MWRIIITRYRERNYSRITKEKNLPIWALRISPSEAWQVCWYQNMKIAIHTQSIIRVALKTHRLLHPQHHIKAINHSWDWAWGWVFQLPGLKAGAAGEELTAELLVEAELLVNIIFFICETLTFQCFSCKEDFCLVSLFQGGCRKAESVQSLLEFFCLF